MAAATQKRIRYSAVYSEIEDDEMGVNNEEQAKETTLEAGYREQLETLLASRKESEDFELEAIKRLKKAQNKFDDIRNECLILNVRADDMNKTVGQQIDELTGFLKEYQAKENDKMAQSDTLTLIEQVKLAKTELGKTLERMMGAQRRAVGLRTNREVAQSEVEGHIKNLEQFAKQRLKIDREIDVATQSLEEERARRLQISEIERRYEADVHEVFETVSLSRRVLVETTTQPIMGKFFGNDPL